MEKYEKRIWLVQRMRREDRNSPGVDKYFSYDYMGASEFEWGALPNALRELREQEYEKWEPIKIQYEGHTIWYIGPERLLQKATDFAKDQLQPDNKIQGRLKERTNINRVYGIEKASYRLYYDSWWCVDEGISFCLFKNKESAEKWLLGMKDRSGASK